jgi:S-disulfanyl-L-cysteine oxidoreductase SoxD
MIGSRWLAAASLLCVGACKVAPPGRLETAVVTRVKHHLTVGRRSEPNPLPDTPEAVDAGRRAFAAYCMACHGLDGRRTGVPFAEAMSPPVPDLSTSAVQDYSDGQLAWVIENGLSPSGMPAARGLLHEDEIWRIVRYLRHLPPAGSLGEPPCYAGGCAVTSPPARASTR